MLFWADLTEGGSSVLVHFFFVRAENLTNAGNFADFLQEVKLGERVEVVIWPRSVTQLLFWWCR